MRDVDSGTVYGPFTYEAGAVLVIENRSYELQRTNTAGDRLIARMKKIIVPRIEFREADIRDVVVFMRDAAEAADPAGEGVNVVLSTIRDRPAAEQRESKVIADDPWGQPFRQPAGPATGPRITLSLRRVSVYDALSIIAELADLNFKVDDRGLVLLDDKGQEVERVEW